MGKLDYLIIHVFTSFILSTLIFPLFIRLLKKRNVLDPQHLHKIHEHDVPSLGGIVMVVSGFITVLFFFPFETLAEYKFFLGGLFLLLVIGLRDDLLPLNPFIKLISQLIPCIIVFFAMDVSINSLYSIWDIDFSIYIALPLTCFTLIIITNSFNLIDGIDGLAGMLSVISLSVFAAEIYIHGHIYISYLLAAFIGAQIGFLFFNWPPAKIFMGDTGALFYGFLLACAAVIFLNINYESESPAFQATVASTMGIIGIPLVDTFRIIIYRIGKGKSPTSADQNHIHHLLLKLGFSHTLITLSYVSVQLMVIALLYILRSWNEWAIFLLLGTFYFGLIYLINHQIKIRGLKIQD